MLKKAKGKNKTFRFLSTYVYVNYQAQFVLRTKVSKRRFSHTLSPFCGPYTIGVWGGGVEDGGYDLNKRESAQPEDDTTQVSAFLAE